MALTKVSYSLIKNSAVSVMDYGATGDDNGLAQGLYSTATRWANVDTPNSFLTSNQLSNLRYVRFALTYDV